MPVITFNDAHTWDSVDIVIFKRVTIRLLPVSRLEIKTSRETNPTVDVYADTHSRLPYCMITGYWFVSNIEFNRDTTVNRMKNTPCIPTFSLVERGGRRRGQFKRTTDNTNRAAELLISVINPLSIRRAALMTTTGTIFFTV